MTRNRGTKNVPRSRVPGGCDRFRGAGGRPATRHASLLHAPGGCPDERLTPAPGWFGCRRVLRVVGEARVWARLLVVDAVTLVVLELADGHWIRLGAAFDGAWPVAVRL